MEKIIKENKPNISESSLKTYCSLLKSLYYKKHDKDDEIKPNWFNNEDEIIEMLKDKVPSSRKTTYAALISITTNNDKYKKNLMDDGKSYDKFIDSQTKSKSQEKNWKDFSEIKTIYEEQYNKVKPFLNFKNIDKNEYKKLQEFIILSLTCGYWIPPRRSLDWCHMKIKNIDKEKDNYIDKNEFVFNSFKTAKFYSTQRVEIPKGLKIILNKWIKLNPHDYLITGDNGNLITNVRLAQILNKIFDGKISTSLLRHIYLSDKLKEIPKLEELKSLAKNMGNSPMQAIEYIKK